MVIISDALKHFTTLYLFILVNDLLGQRIPITEQQYDDKNLVKPSITDQVDDKNLVRPS